MYIVQKCMYSVQKCMYSVQKCIHTIHIAYIYIYIYPGGLYVHYSYRHTLYRTRLSNLQTPKKYSVLNGNYVLILHEVFEEHNPGTKLDLPVLKN